MFQQLGYCKMFNLTLLVAQRCPQVNQRRYGHDSFAARASDWLPLQGLNIWQEKTEQQNLTEVSLARSRYLLTTRWSILCEPFTSEMASCREPLSGTVFTCTITSPARRRTAAAALPSSTWKFEKQKTAVPPTCRRHLQSFCSYFFPQ